MGAAQSHEELQARKRQKTNDQGGTPELATPGVSFLGLPRELRDMIYKCLFSTRLTHGAEWIDDNGRSRAHNPTGTFKANHVKPAPYLLVILRTCHQIHDEANHLWLGRVLFNFDGLFALFDKLYLLPASKLSQIRDVRLRTAWMRCRTIPGYHPEADLHEVFTYLPQLRLETLTVLGPRDGLDASKDLEGMITQGQG